MSENKKTLFGYDAVKNHPSRNGFDLSKRRLFTSSLGQLCPIWWKPTLPSDEFKINLQSFTRTQPLNTAAYTRLREYYDFFFVPYRQLWRGATQALQEIDNVGEYALSPNSTATTAKAFPHTTTENLLTYLKANQNGVQDAGLMDDRYTKFKLFQYLGMLPQEGDFKSLIKDQLEAGGLPSGSLWNSRNTRVSMMPLLAYQKIWSDFYRNKYWVENDATQYNVDYKTEANPYMSLQDFDGNDFQMRYALYSKDILTGILPSPQYGKSAVMESLWANNKNQITISGTTILDSPKVDIFQYRNAVALQKYKEIQNSANRDYASQMQAHFGVTLNPLLANQVDYLGGFQFNIEINQVTNTFLNSASSTPLIKGNGSTNIMTRNGNEINFKCQEHGIIMCIYHCAPIPDYVTNGLPYDNALVDISDYAKSEFDSLGLEPLNSNHYSTFYGDPNGERNYFVGYVPRYSHWKTDIDDAVGGFTSSPGYQNWFSKKEMVIGNPDEAPADLFISQLYVSPIDANSIFSVVQNSGEAYKDQFQTACDLNIQAIRPLDFDGMPY